MPTHLGRELQHNCHALLEALSIGHIEIKDSSKRGGSDWSYVTNALLSYSQTRASFADSCSLDIIVP